MLLYPRPTHMLIIIFTRTIDLACIRPEPGTLKLDLDESEGSFSIGFRCIAHSSGPMNTYAGLFTTRVAAVATCTNDRPEFLQALTFKKQSCKTMHEKHSLWKTHGWGSTDPTDGQVVGICWHRPACNVVSAALSPGTAVSWSMIC